MDRASVFRTIGSALKKAASFPTENSRVGRAITRVADNKYVGPVVNTMADSIRLPAPQKVVNAAAAVTVGTGRFFFKESAYDKEGILGTGIEMSKKGKAFAAAAIVGSVPLTMFQDYENSWMGQTSNGVQTMRPSLQEYKDPSYLNTTNADGSLVFALNKLRNG